jgi:hypothetical protein
VIRVVEVVMARSRDLSPATFSDDLRHLKEVYIRVGAAIWRNGFEACISAMQDAAEEASRKSWFRAFVRGAGTYCREMVMILPRTVNDVVHERGGRKSESIDQEIQELANMPQISRRVVQLFIVDPDPKVPDEKSLVWQGESKVTDLSDEELWFDEGVRSGDDIKKKLEAHNLKRRDLELADVRLRDLQRKVALFA